MKSFTTFFDKNYLSKGIVLINSLKLNCTEFKLYLLCLDDEVFNFFELNKSTFPEVFAIKLSELEDFDNSLLVCKSNRSIVEYYFTLSPCLPLFLLEKYNLTHICSLDADIKFHASPDPLFDYLEKYSIVVTPHKFSSENLKLIEWGKFNVSFQIFKNNQTGLLCLNKWRLQCIDWCKDILEDNRFADQKYLDNWEEEYKGNIKVLNDSTSGVAPWNLDRFNITLKNNCFFSDSERLIFYHFHHLKKISKNWTSTGFEIYNVTTNKFINLLYKDYLVDVKRNEMLLNEKKQDVINLRKQDLRNIRVKILEDNQVFFNLTQNFFFINLKKLNRIIRFFILRLYAKVN